MDSVSGRPTATTSARIATQLQRTRADRSALPCRAMRFRRRSSVDRYVDARLWVLGTIAAVQCAHVARPPSAFRVCHVAVAQTLWAYAPGRVPA